MYKILFIAILLISISVFGADLPDSVEVTMGNAKSLGVMVTEEDSGASNIKLLYLRFPQHYKGCAAGRVSSTLLNNDGDEVTSSSMDYQVGSSTPSILAHFNPSSSDMAFVIQYCCNGAKYLGCKSALVINSIKELGAWK